MAPSLSPAHEARLRLFLDEQVAGLERDARKHTLVLGPLIPRLRATLGAILTLPSTLSGTRTAYFLTLTSLLLDTTTSLPLITVPPTSSDPDAMAEDEQAEQLETQAGEIMEDYLSLLEQVNSAWLALLTTNGWHAPRRFREAVYDGEGVLTLDVFQGSIGHPHSHSHSHPQSQPDTSQPGQGAGQGAGQGSGPEAKDAATEDPEGAHVDATSQIRLRSVLQLGREKVLAWARPYGDFGGEVLGPSGSEGHETTQDERDGWEGRVLRLFEQPLAEIERQQGPVGPNEGLPLGGLPEYDIPPCPRDDDEKDGDDDGDDDEDMEEVQV